MKANDRLATFLETPKGLLFCYYLEASREPVVRTEELKEDTVFADWDAKGRLVGVEILAPLNSKASRWAAHFFHGHATKSKLTEFALILRESNAPQMPKKKSAKKPARKEPKPTKPASA